MRWGDGGRRAPRGTLAARPARLAVLWLGAGRRGRGGAGRAAARGGLLAPVDELLRADVLAEDGGLLACRHDLICDAVRGALPRTALGALQRQAAGALLAAGSPAVEVAAQLAASAEPGRPVADGGARRGGPL